MEQTMLIVGAPSEHVNTIMSPNASGSAYAPPTEPGTTFIASLSSVLLEMCPTENHMPLAHIK